jgi:glycosyltransferase involved in cell wall biosynthesis
LLPALQARGHEIVVVTYTDEPKSFTDTTTFGYPVHRISRSYPIPVRLFKLTQAILHHASKADVVFISDYGLPTALANLWLRKPTVIKNVSDFTYEFSVRHGWIPADVTIDQFQTLEPKPWRVNLLWAVQRWYTQRATLVLAPSNYSASLPIGWGIPKEKVRVVYNAVGLERFQHLPPKAQLRQELGWGDEPHLLAVSRLAPWKHFDQIIAAFADVQKRLPNAHLTLIGGGPQWAYLQACAAPFGNAITMTGALPVESVYRYLRAADVYVQYSTYEGLPHTAVEAFVAGTPVVLSTVGGNPEVVTAGENGLLVPPGNPPLFANAICQLLENPPLQEHFVQAGKATAHAKFNWSLLVEQTEGVIIEAVKKTGAGKP